MINRLIDINYKTVEALKEYQIERDWNIVRYMTFGLNKWRYYTSLINSLEEEIYVLIYN